MYGVVFTQAIPSPVAYLPSEAIDRGYKVIKELSRGWIEGQIPFLSPSPWKRTQEVEVYGDSVALYLEGVVGKVSVYQERRLLWRGESPQIWVPLVGRGKAKLTIAGEKGGIIGGAYLVARVDTQVWQRAAYPEIVPSCKQPNITLSLEEALHASAVSQGRHLCVRYPFLPPGRIREVLLYHQHSLMLSSSESSDIGFTPSFFSDVVFVLIWVILGGIVSVFPTIRTAFWTGWLRPFPTDPVETGVGLLWLGSGMSFSLWRIGQISLLWILLLCLVAELLIFEWINENVNWIWQSWLLPTGILAIVSLVYPSFCMYAALGLWGIRSLRFILYSPKFAYLCLAEVFMFILHIPLDA